MRYCFVHRHLSTAFQGLGHCISKHPLWFVIVPIITTGFLALGFIRLYMETRLEYLFVPLNGRSKTERSSIESLFPRSELQEIGRFTSLPLFGSVIATAKDDGSILREPILDEIAILDSIIRKITIKWDNQSFSYTDICLKDYNGQCFSNDGFKAHRKIGEMQRGKFKIKYPLDKDELTMSASSYPYNFGGVSVDEENYVKYVQAFRLFYFLDDFTEERQDKSKEWMMAFLDEVSQTTFDKIKVTRLTRESLDVQTNKITINVYPLLIIAAIVMIVFGAVSCMTSDWITSKPWLGIAGCISSLLGCASAFGILLLFGAEYADINIAVVFLMLGIGMDDSFVILAAWRNTDPKETVEKRMSQSYSEAAVSVSITSLTNFLASCIGLTTPYRVIRIYSLYSAIAILFAYIAQITFFGGCMAHSGQREFKNQHAVFCFPVTRNSSKGCCHTVLTEGCGDIKHIHLNGTEASNSISFQAFHLLGKILSKAYIKLAVVLIFAIYFVLGLYFIKNYLVLAFDYTTAFPFYSYAKSFVGQQYRYFSEYSFNFQVVINATLDYSDPKIQEDIEEILHKIESSPYVHGSFSTESWLREYLSFKNKRAKLWFLEKLDTNNSEDFIDGLRNVFLKMVTRFKEDVRFSEDGRNIVASRFMCASVNIYDAVEERKFINDVWKIADGCKYPVYVYNPYFFLYDLSSGIERITVQCLIASAVLVIMVFVLFIPNFICALSVCTTVLLIETGLIGFMSLWNVQLNIISMICLIISVGLCVDYSAHISYSFISSKETVTNEKLRKALLSVGYPAFQGCVSTILGVIVLSVAPMESVVMFFKVICLVMILSFFHAVLLLPVMLSLWQDLWNFLKEQLFLKCWKTRKVKRIDNGVTEVEEAIL